MFRVATATTVLGLLTLGATGCIRLEPEDLSASVDLPAGISADLVVAATANLARVPPSMLSESPHRFVEDLVAEYRTSPEQLQRRLEVLASMEFSEAGPTPGVTAPRPSPFQGLTRAQLDSVVQNQERVLAHHLASSGSAAVRPLSVCETRFLVESARSAPGAPAWASSCGDIQDWDAYARAYAAYAQGCGPSDLEEWYAFHASGRLGTRWLESSLAGRFGSRMNSACSRPDAGPACARWAEDRLGYRRVENAEIALRFFYTDPSPALQVPASGLSLAQNIQDPMIPGILVEDRNGDGIGEWIAPSDLRPSPGAILTIPARAVVALPRAVTGVLRFEGTMLGRTLPAGTRVRLPSGAEVSLARSLRRPAESTEAIVVGRDVWVAAAEGVLDDGSSVWLSDIVVSLGEELRLPVAGPALAGSVGTNPPAPDSQSVTAPTILQAQIPLQGGGFVLAEVKLADVHAYDQVDPRWNAAYLSRPDLGLAEAFVDASACGADQGALENCPLLARIRALLDRTQDYYASFFGPKLESARVESVRVASPIVAAALTLQGARLLQGAVPGPVVVHVLRVPYRELLSTGGGADTLSSIGVGAPPSVLTVQDLAQGAPLDLTRTWLDDSTLASNKYGAEYPVSMLGMVAAAHLDGLLLFPAAQGSACP